MKKIIKGLDVHIDEKKAADWHMFNILKKSDGASQYEQVAIMFEAIEYMSDQTEETIVEFLGGDSAQTADVIGLASEIVKAATAKN